MVALKHVGKGGGVIHPLHGVQKLSGKQTLCSWHKKTNPSVLHVTSQVGQYKFAQKSGQKPGKSDSLPYKVKQVQVYMLISLNRAKKNLLDLCNSELVWG